MLRCLLLFPVLLLIACSSRQPAVTDSFGAAFSAEEVVAATDLLDRYTTEQLTDTVATTLKGTVSEVCQAKGCWLTMNAGPGETMMVTFKDYAFFVPKDIAEREVILSGQAYYQTTPVVELRHYAEDAGKSEEEIAAITEPKRELRFLASGVQLY